MVWRKWPYLWHVAERQSGNNSIPKGIFIFGAKIKTAVFSNWQKELLKCIKHLYRLQGCCGQLWVWHMFCGESLWWVMPPNKSMDRIETPLGSQSIVWTFVRHTASRCLIFTAPPVPTYGSTWVVLWPFVFRSAPSTFPHRQSTFRGLFPGVPSH